MLLYKTSVNTDGYKCSNRFTLLIGTFRKGVTFLIVQGETGDLGFGGPPGPHGSKVSSSAFNIST